MTGEEEDQTIHSIRCKIHLMVEGAWVERGIGLLKLNVTRNGDRSGARLGTSSSFLSLLYPRLDTDED